MYIYKAGIVGAGKMGAEIAQVISYAGIPVVIKDINDKVVKRAIDTARKIYKGRVDKGKLSPEEMESKMALISGTTTYEPFKDVDIVIEAVPESLELKRQVFKELDEATQPSAILASNTSALSISALGAATKKPEKVIGMHFFFPAHVMKLVEVIPSLATSQETIDDVISLSESLRKIPVRVNECPGFLINRLLMPYLNEAVYCLQEGAASAKEIDKAMVEFGFPMGPFTLVDNLGLDICAEVGKILYDGYGERMRPAALWNKLIEAKRFGVRSEAGFYDYKGVEEHGEGKADTVLDNFIKEVQAQTKVTGTKFSVERLILPMINEAAFSFQENISTAQDIDLAMLAGLGFPQDKQGILHYADAIGIDNVLKGLEDLRAKFSERFFPAYMLKKMVNANHLGVKTKRGFFEYA